MTARRLHRRGAPALLPAALGCALLGATGSAQAQVVGRFTASASVSDGYSSNPFLLDGDDTGSGYLEFSVTPTYVLIEPRASTTLTGYYSRSEYFRRYNNSSGYGAALNHSRRLDPRTSLNLGINFGSSIQGERTSAFAPPFAGQPEVPGQAPLPDPTQPQQPGVPSVPGLPVDPTLIGRGLRQDSLGVNASISTSPSAFDSYSLSVRANRSFTGARAAGDHRTYGETLSYSRRLSELVDVGAQFSVERTDYSGGIFPGALILQPQLTYSHRLSPSLSLDGALGAVFVNSEGPGDSRSLSGNLSLCWTDPRSSLCLTADRSAGASGGGGVSKQLSSSLNYSYRLSPYDSVSAGISYNRSDLLAAENASSEYLSTNIGWSNQATQRLTGGANLSFRRAFQSLRSGSADVNGQVYLRLSFGR